MKKSYVVVVQCHIVKERCSGYFCEQAFSHRSGAFTAYDEDAPIRMLSMTCGGCCGRAAHRKLGDLLRAILKKEKIDKGEIVVHLSSCIVKDSFHGSRCPHLDYLKELIQRHSLDIVEGSRFSSLSEKRRSKGGYMVPS